MGLVHSRMARVWILAWIVGLSWGVGLVSSAAAGSSFVWSAVRSIDLSAPFAEGTSLGDVSCPSVALCVAVDGNRAVLSSTGVGRAGVPTWKRVSVTSTLGAVSCPSVALCVAIDWDGGGVAVSRDPRDGRGWRRVGIDPSAGLQDLSCPSVRLCVALSASGSVFTSTDPRARRSAWHHVRAFPRGNLGSVWCPTMRLCVATETVVVSGVAGPTEFATSSDPAGREPSWRMRQAISGLRVRSLACSSETYCIAVGTRPDDRGGLIASGNPTAAGSWRIVGQSGTAPLTRVTCPSPSRCMAGGETGIVVTVPTRGGWTSARAVHRGEGIAGLSCPNPDLCVAAGDGGSVAIKRTFGGRHSGWRSSSVDGESSIRGLACPSADRCLALDDAGKILTTTDPSGSWHVVTGVRLALQDIQLPTGLFTVACPSVTLCVAESGHRIVSSTDPFARSPTWQPSRDFGYPIVAVACASVSLCVAIDRRPTVGVHVSTNPAGGPSTWRTTVRVMSKTYYSDDQWVTTLACPSVRLCVAGATGGPIWSVNPTGPASAWHQVAPAVGEFQALSCPSVQFCLATTPGGFFETSTDPAGSRWRRVLLNGPLQYNVIDASCQSISFCVGIAGPGIITTTNPLRGPRTWRLTPIRMPPDKMLITQSCPSSSLCVAAGDEGLLTVGRPSRQ